MHEFPLYPLEKEAECLGSHCNLPLHIGTAKIGHQEEVDPANPAVMLYRFANPDAPTLSEIEFDTAFLMPADGKCLIFLQNRPDFRLGQLFGQDLVVPGDSADGQFTLRCPQFYVQAEGEGPGERRWAIATPVNSFAELTYEPDRPIARVRALLNNFDFDCGNTSGDPQKPHRCEILRVQAAGHAVDFSWREGHEQIKTLLTVGELRLASLTSFTFDAWENATEEDLVKMVADIADFCGLIARQHTGVPLFSFLDAAGRPVRVLIREPIKSSYRRDYIVDHLRLPHALPKLFEQCFENYRAFNKSELWRRIPGSCKSIPDATYLEQKCATLMGGLECFLRSSLIEARQLTVEQAGKLMLPGLIGAARMKLGWDIPQHYTANDRTRLLRNAVMHGDRLPQSPKQVSHEIDKWSLFLMRRVLMRLGFDGLVASPSAKTRSWSESPVNDFSEEHNSFVT